MNKENLCNLCPVCGELGNTVKNITVKHMVLKELTKSVEENDYYLCINEECNIVYYNQESGISFDKKEVKVPIWYKKDADPKYVCYCNKVTEEQVINAVVKNGAKNMKDIITLTGAMKNGKCEIKNPSGKCCHSAVQEAIDNAIQYNKK